MSEFWNMIFSACKAVGNWYWGGFDGLLSSLTVFIVMDHITNVMCAIVDRRPIGRVVVQDIFKSVLILFLVGIGNILDSLTVDPVRRFESHPLHHVGAKSVPLKNTFFGRNLSLLPIFSNDMIVKQHI